MQPGIPTAVVYTLKDVKVRLIHFNRLKAGALALISNEGVVTGRCNGMTENPATTLPFDRIGQK